MEIIEYFECNQDNDWLTRIEKCDWKAAKILSGLLQTPNKFFDVLGDNGKLFILKDADKLVAFATLTQRECIKDDSLYPWIGFVYTRPEHRGNRFSERIVEHACNVAKEHAGELYIKYGFVYKENMMDVFGVENQVFYKDI